MEYWTEIEIGEYDTPSYKLIQVCFDCKMTWENDGIGSYEFWGFKGYDKGTDYAVCEDIKVISKHSKKELKIVNDYLLENWDSLVSDICEKYENNCIENDPRN